MARLLVIAAGGTGGHMFPAQSLAQEMLRRGWRVALSTDPRGARYATGFPAEVERREVASATFARGGPLAKALVPARIAAGVASAVAWFLRARPAAVIGFGGYPSIPALAAGLLTGAPRLIHEQNGVLGRVNRRFAPRVAVVACGTWPLVNAPAGAALERVGNPVRDAVLEAAGTPWAPPGDGPVRLLVTGGSQGASSFRLIPEGVAALPDDLRARLRVVHQAREEDREAVAAAYRAAGVAAEVASFFPDLPARMAAAHLVVARAGASTVAELAAIGRPSVLIPFPAAMDDHQTANARALVDAGAARLCPEPLTPAALSAHIAAALANGAEMAAAARARGAPEAARTLADLVERHARP